MEYGAYDHEPLNPWRDIWTKPRAVVRQELNREIPSFFIPAVLLAGINSGLDRASLRSLGDKYEAAALFPLAVIGGMVGGMIGLYLWSWLIGITGRRLGGHADSYELRVVIGITSIPLAVGLIIWIASLYLFGMENFTESTPKIDTSVSLTFWFLCISLLEIALVIWASIIICKGIGEAHGFSAWFGLLAAIFAGILVIAVVAAFVMLLIMLGFGFA